jgi:hypothetical protein
VFSHGILHHSRPSATVCSKFLFLVLVFGELERERTGGDLGEEAARAVRECQALLVGLATRVSVAAMHRLVSTACLHLTPKWPLLGENPTGDI